MRRRVVKAVGIAGKRNRLDQVLVQDENRHMTVRDAIREFEPHNLALEEQRANLIELEKEFERAKRPQKYERIKDGCREILQPVKDGEREVVEAMRVAGSTSSVSPFGRSTFPASGEGKGVGDTPRTVKLGEKIVVEAMRAKASPWRSFQIDQPEPGRLVAIAVLQFDKKSWSYSAEITDRASIEYWQMVKSDVRWLPLPEVEA